MQKPLRLSLICLAVLLLPTLVPAQTHPHQQRSQHVRAGDQRAHWHGDIRQFHSRDYSRWRGGKWHHGTHDGRTGWWWIVGLSWYYYAAPIYPYPNPYYPSAVIYPEGVAPTYLYYCPDPAGYYPYQSYCRVGWQLVPAP